MSTAAAKELRFVRRMRPLRALGLGLGFFCVAGVFHQNGMHPLLWAILLLNGFVWPQFAYFLASRSADPQKAEFRNLLVDSTAGGVWVALMQFNLLPSVVLVTMLSMDKISIGGWRFLARTATAQALACLVVSALNGFVFAPITSMTEIAVCLPFLVVYPVAVATVTYALSRTVTRQNKLLEELNRIDSLTGLLNRGHWEEVLLGELRRHQRIGRPAALLMLDIDRFKPINDQQGHPVGDEVIRGVAG
ncbi:MAG: MASE2 domain-containing protein, partial [Nevskiales bacterium]